MQADDELRTIVDPSFMNRTMYQLTHLASVLQVYAQAAEEAQAQWYHVTGEIVVTALTIASPLVCCSGGTCMFLILVRVRESGDRSPKICHSGWRAVVQFV